MNNSAAESAVQYAFGSIKGTGADDLLSGGDGNDNIFAGTGADVVSGGSGDDDILGQGGSDQLSGDSGRDTLRGGSGDDIVSGGAGDDLLFGQGNNDLVHGDAGNDTLQGAAGADTLTGDQGDDRLNGGLGRDYLDGGTGNDTMIGGTQSDTFVFASNYGRDRINGFEQSVDVIKLHDTLWAGDSSITTGQDVVDSFGSSNSRGTLLTLNFDGGEILEIQNAAGLDLSSIGARISIVKDGAGRPQAPSFPTPSFPTPADYASQVYGNAGDNRLTALPAGSWLEGGSGNDKLIGSGGDDYFRAGPGNDFANGGAGSDIFEFGLGSERFGVNDFTIGEDKIALTDGLTFADLTKSFSTAGSPSVIFTAPDGSSIKLKNVVDLDASHFITLGSTPTGPTNQAPVGNDDAYTTPKGTTLKIASSSGVLANDTDANGDALGVSIFAAASHGLVVLNPNGSFDYTPNSGFSGTDSFDYTVSDGNGGTDTATVNIDVTNTTPPDPGTGAKEFSLVMTVGQSVAAGATDWPSRETFTVNPFDEERALMALFDDGDFLGIEPLREIRYETMSSSMIRHLLNRYDEVGIQSPNFLHTNAAVSGASILDFLTGADDVYASVRAGASATQSGKHFAVSRADGGFDHYIDEGNTAFYTKSTNGRTPVLEDGLIANATNSIEGAIALDYAISDTVLFNWIHGQADAALGGQKYGYDYHLELLLGTVEAGIEDHLGRNVDLVTSVSQQRGYGPKDVAFEGLAAALEIEGAHLGILEYEFQASEPSDVGRDYTHFSNEGYYLAGAQLGLRFFDALEGNENAPILIDSVQRGGTNEVLVNFKGVDGALVNDPSIYNSAAGFSVPSNFGFGVYENRFRPSEDYQILSANIVDADTVSLVFNQAPVDGLTLILGRTGETLIDPAISSQGRDFGGTTLRGSDTVAILPPEQGSLEEQFVYEYAPIQSYDLNFA